MIDNAQKLNCKETETKRKDYANGVPLFA